MIEWLAAPIDPSRLHIVTDAVAWHGRLMTAAWGVLLPLGVLIARFSKITPGQDWPTRVDNRLWWHAHLALQYTGGVVMLVGLLIVLAQGQSSARWQTHGLMGYAVVLLGAVQFLSGWLRGTKGGPTEAQMRGDHYDMTLRRRIFEFVHKSMGYGALLLGAAATLTGLWQANAPHWMWLTLAAWWCLLSAAFIVLQRQGRAFDTYQAIWGPDPRHPGNALAPNGWGMRRPQPFPKE